MKLNIPADFGDTFYMINDEAQDPCTLVGLYVVGDGGIKYQLSYLGTIFTVYDYECTKEKRIG